MLYYLLNTIQVDQGSNDQLVIDAISVTFLWQL